MEPLVSFYFLLSRSELGIDARVRYENGIPVVDSIRILFRDKIDVTDAIDEEEKRLIEERAKDRFVEEYEARRIRMDDVLTHLGGDLEY